MLAHRPAGHMSVKRMSQGILLPVTDLHGRSDKTRLAEEPRQVADFPRLAAEVAGWSFRSTPPRGGRP